MDLKKGNWNPLEFNIENFASELLADDKKPVKKRPSGLEDKKFVAPPASKLPSSNQNVKNSMAGLGAPSPSNKLGHGAPSSV